MVGMQQDTDDWFNSKETVVDKPVGVPRLKTIRSKRAPAVKAAVEPHSAYVDTRTQKEQHLKQEEELYTEEFKKSLDESGYEKAVTDMYAENQMEVSSEGLVCQHF